MPTVAWFSRNIYRYGVGGVPKPDFVPRRLKAMIASHDCSEGRLGAEVRMSIESFEYDFQADVRTKG